MVNYWQKIAFVSNIGLNVVYIWMRQVLIQTN